MQTPISVQDKKSFIQWFLNHYQLKKRESVWILNYLVNHNEILANVHFVQDAKFCPRGIIITAHCSDDVPFRFYKKQLVTTDAEKSFHDIRLNQDDPLYIQLNFNNARQNANYVAVLEENPFTPEDYFITKKDKLIVEQLLDKTLFDYQRELLKLKIDHALDEMDQTAFFELSRDLYNLEENYFSQPKKQKQ
ncbi:MAG TPA: ReoY family proteolytic degradation factor [Virgibacillus sp.]|nr:ReoY family proteolytic degradation factor [Virgibacillus sp.]